MTTRFMTDDGVAMTGEVLPSRCIDWPASCSNPRHTHLVMRFDFDEDDQDDSIGRALRDAATEE